MLPGLSHTLPQEYLKKIQCGQCSLDDQQPFPPTLGAIFGWHLLTDSEPKPRWKTGRTVTGFLHKFTELEMYDASLDFLHIKSRAQGAKHK